MNRKNKNHRRDRAADLIERFRAGVVSGELTIAEGTQIIEELQDMADEAISLAEEMLKSPDKETRRAILLLLREMGDRRAIQPLEQILQHKYYSDADKMDVIQTLDALGYTVDRGIIDRVISDPQALMQASRAQMLETIEDPDSIEMLLEMMGESSPEMMETYVRDALAPLADERLLLLFITLLHSEHDGVVMMAIDGIERIKEPATIPVLEERAQHDPSRQVRHAAESAALRLRARVGNPPKEQHIPPWIHPSPLPLVSCFLSTIDGSGGQVLFVARQQSDGSLQVVDYMFNDHQGIKDCFSGIIDEQELGEMMDVFGKVEFVDVRLERARDAIDSAYRVTLDARRRLPPPFVAWQGWLEGEESRSVEEFPLPTFKPSRQDDLLEGCAELLETDEFEYWFFNPHEVAAFTDPYRRLLRKKLARGGNPDFEDLVDEAIETLIDEEYRHLLADRLHRQAWLLAQIYEDEVIPLWAIAAATALEEGITTKHPLLRGMIERSFLNAVGRYL